MEKFNCPKTLVYQKSFSTIKAAYDFACALQEKTKTTLAVYPEYLDGSVVYIVYKIIDFNYYHS